MAHTRQTSFEELEYQRGRQRRQTRKARKLELLGSTTCWEDLVALVEPHRPKAGGRGRQPWPTETLLRMYFVQVWLNLSDEATEDECYDSLAVRDFVGCYDGVPDATTLANFRHLIEDEHIDELYFEAVVERLDEAGLISRSTPRWSSRRSRRRTRPASATQRCTRPRRGRTGITPQKTQTRRRRRSQSWWLWHPPPSRHSDSAT